MQKKIDVKKLKKGFTTGSCAAVTAKGAWMLLSGKVPIEKINLLFPDGKYRTLCLKNCEIRKSSAVASIIKDAGDDPDVTDKAIISSEIKRIEEKDISPKDHILECGKAKVILRGGDGVGLVTKLGLEIGIGKWAINPVPQKMIVDNLRDAGLGESKTLILVTVSIQDGEKLAERTLNPTLGIQGGLSILGTTGIVEPKSHAAYIRTIEILLKGLSLEGCETAVLCTGARTLNSARDDFPEIPEFAFIRIGDFIADSLRASVKLNFKTLIVSCMPGKLFKYSSGHEYTHAHNVKLDINEILPILVENNTADAIINTALDNVTFRGVLESLNPELRKKVLDNTGKKAIKEISKWTGGVPCEIRCYGYEKNLLGTWKS